MLHQNKINIPLNEQDYILGKGEECFACFDKNEQDMYDMNSNGKGEVVLKNDSLYYPRLKSGTTVPIEFRGKNKPIVPFYWLQENYA